MNAETITLLLQVAEKVGIFALAIGFFIWRDWKREKDLGEKLNQREEFIQGRLADVIEKNTTALIGVIEAVRDCPKKGSGS